MNYPTQHSADRHAHTPSVTHRHQDDRADDLTDNNSLTEGDGISIASVRQATFVARYQAVWHEFDRLVDECGQSLYFDTKDNSQNNTQNNVQDDSRVQILGSDASLATKYGSGSKRSFWGRRDLDGRVAMRYPIVELYRQICQHYALAKQRHYSPKLVAQLHARVLVGHRMIYNTTKNNYFGRVIHFYLITFPNAVREHRFLFWLSFALFYVPVLIMGIGCYLNQELIYSVMSPYEVLMMEYMYDPANGHVGRSSERASDTDLMMFGHYIYNNISIDFQVYATGVLFGVGTVLSTLYNGILIGGLSGHLIGKGYAQSFLPFVSGHGSFELMALVIASAAGLKLATPFIAPAPYSRKDAFLVAGKQSIVLLIGAATMTLIAAFIEAFWSPSPHIPDGLKYAMGIVFWLMVAWYLIFCGRGKSVP